MKPALRLLGEKHQAVNQRFRYKRQTVYYRHVYAIDIILLPAAGSIHTEIGDFYNLAIFQHELTQRFGMEIRPA